MAFLNADQLVAAYDDRRVRQLLSDSGTPVTGDLDSNTTLTQLIGEATGEIVAATASGERYNEDDLQDLADSDTTGGFLIRRLCADLVMALLVSRRAQSAADVDRQVPRYNAALRLLEQLRQGSRVFPTLEEGRDGGTPALGNENPRLNPNRPTLFSDRASRAFPYDPNRGVGYGNGYYGC